MRTFHRPSFPGYHVRRKKKRCVLPKYQYRCQQCQTELEVQQKFTDDALTECPECHGTLRKVYSAVGVVFKGSGFYKTDSRAESKSGGSESASASQTTKSEPSKSESSPKKESSTSTSTSSTAGSAA